MPASAQVTKLNVQPIRNLRWWIGALLFASTVINYIDRQTLSLLSPYLKQLYHWTNSDYANLLIGFRIAYSIGQSVCGRLMDRVGTRRGLTLSVLWYSIVSMATSLAGGFYSFATFRFSLGAGEDIVGGRGGDWGVVGGHGVGVLGIEDLLGVLRDGERSTRGILHLARGRGTGEARDAAGRGEIHGVRRVGVLIAAENVASLDRGPADGHHLLEQRLHFAGDALPARGVDGESCALGCQNPRAVHKLGGGSKGSIGGVGVGFGHREILLDLRVAGLVSVQLEDSIELARSVRRNVHAFAAGSLAAGLVDSALHPGHVGKKSFRGGTENADHISTL